MAIVIQRAPGALHLLHLVAAAAAAGTYASFRSAV
jgi:hypothetical protein